MFECKSLEVLELGKDMYLHVPIEPFVLPNLKVLKLYTISLRSYCSISDLLSGCPVLEDLLLSFDIFEGYMIEICHPLLKYLLLVGPQEEYCVTLDTPNLHSLIYRSDRAVKFLSETMKSLVDAHIGWGSTRTQSQQFETHDIENLTHDSRLGTDLFHEMRYASYLYLKSSAINALYFSKLRLTTFHNLTIMELGSTSLSRWLVLPKLLKSSPNLKSLVFCEGFIDIDSVRKDVAYRLPQSVPGCFIRSIQEIKVRDFYGHKCELELVEYFLKSVRSLKMMMIGVQVCSMSPLDRARMEVPVNLIGNPPEWVVPTCERLSVAPRCSKACQIILTSMESPEKYCEKML